MQNEFNSSQPIGVFDSGVGGLSVLRAIHQELPHENYLYLGDQQHVPYGSRSLEEVRQLSDGMTRYLLSKGAKLIVVACNTASAAALRFLRERYTQIPFVGMEPAVKPAAEHTHTGKVGVLATPATFQGELYASVVERFAQGVKIFQSTCPGLVAQVEAGSLHTQKTRRILKEALLPMLTEGIDTVVLGCTHYPFVLPLIQEIAGAGVRVIDPAPAIAKQVRRLLQEHSLLNHQLSDGSGSYLTSANPQNLEQLLPKFLQTRGKVSQVYWIGESIYESQNQHPPV